MKDISFETASKRGVRGEEFHLKIFHDGKYFYLKWNYDGNFFFFYLKSGKGGPKGFSFENIL